MRTLNAKELAEVRELIYMEITINRQNYASGNAITPKPPDEIFQFDHEVDYFKQSTLLLESAAAASNPNDMYRLTLDAAVTLVELLEMLRDTGKLRFSGGDL